MRLRPFVLTLLAIGAVCACPPTTYRERIRNRGFADEMAAIRALSIINTAQAQYRAAYGRYAGTLAELGPPPGGGAASVGAADLIPNDLARGIRSGYVFTLTGLPYGYTANANPQADDTTGTRSFFIDQSGVIREHAGNEPASVHDPEIK